ncbi:hypothetical protein Ocin01_02223 [Orchesella cincta]|uniref:Uncharacterized protein n=1 Tax=Orchesella cincta TaxID=48709 RepID=A0A1D2NGS6_ORCCI|nr:hypothetical protein Ocin01_02223 [Orchesella cincta]
MSYSLLKTDEESLGVGRRQLRETPRRILLEDSDNDEQERGSTKKQKVKSPPKGAKSNRVTAGKSSKAAVEKVKQQDPTDVKGSGKKDVGKGQSASKPKAAEKMTSKNKIKTITKQKLTRKSVADEESEVTSDEDLEVTPPKKSKGTEDAEDEVKANVSSLKPKSKMAEKKKRRGSTTKQGEPPKSKRLKNESEVFETDGDDISKDIIEVVIEQDDVAYMSLQNSDVTKNKFMIETVYIENVAKCIDPHALTFQHTHPGVSENIAEASSSTHVGYALIQPGTIKPLEMLEDGECIYWVLKGAVTVRSSGGIYQDEENRSYAFGKTLKVGACFVAPPNTAFTIENWESDEAMLGYSISRMLPDSDERPES